jgi:hypothetical protein
MVISTPVAQVVLRCGVSNEFLEKISRVEREFYYKYVGQEVRIVLWVGINTRAGFYYWEVELDGVVATSKWERIKFGCRREKANVRKIFGKVVKRSKAQSVWSHCKQEAAWVAQVYRR